MALLLGAAVALPAGLWLGRQEARSVRTVSVAPAQMRRVFSPQVLSYPYFLDRQRKNTAALERQCTERGTFCAEAAAGRVWLDRHGAQP
jgi:hypothetical protein